MNKMKSSFVLKGILAVAAIFSCTTTVFAEGMDYSGDLMTRSTMTGDWGGLRNDLANKGVVFNANTVTTAQSVTGGGKNDEWESGGRSNITMHVDTGKLGLWPGGFLTAEVEGNFGEGVNTRNGGLMPVNSNQLFPITGQDAVAIPALNFMQFLSENFGLVVGKMDTTGGDMNEFAHGKGDSQFMNTAFNVNPTLLFGGPYSTLGAGVIILPNKDPKSAIVSLSVISANGKASTSGFDDLNSDALTYGGEGRVRTDFFGRTGHQLVGALYSNKDFVSMDQRISLEPGSNSIAMEKDTWAVYYNFDQYFFEPVKGSGKGAGVFGRFATTDGNPNLMQYFYSLGIGGKGVMTSRPNDQFGFGWYYIDIKQPTFTGPLATRTILEDEQGIELYYSYALTPWAFVTPNIQVIKGAQEQTTALLPANRTDIDTATVTGIRTQILF